jgi:hypothetical protein
MDRVRTLGGCALPVSLPRVLTFLAISTLVAPELASAKPGFGENIDAYCSGLGRGTPFADLSGRGFLSECSLCHAFTYPPQLPAKANTFDPPAAQYLANQRAKNFAFFCPAAANQLPVIEPIADRSVNIGEMAVIDVSASDADGDPLVLSAANAPPGSSFVDHGDGTATLTWSPGVSDIGPHTVDFRATDDAVPPGQALESVVITVGSSNRPPVLGAIGRQQTDPGVPLEVVITATDADVADTLVVTGSPLPAGATFSDAGGGNALFSWTPDAGQLGNHTVTFRVEDDGIPPASDFEDVRISVGQVNEPPELDAIGSRSVKAGQTLSIPLFATDLDGDALAFSADGLPPTASLTDAQDGTATLIWLPSADEVGVYAVTVSVSDDGTPPETDAESLTLTVEPASPPSAVQVDDALWVEGRERGKLRVRGSGAGPRELIGLLDPQSGVVLGTKRAGGGGGFKLKREPMVPPCEVAVQAGEARSAAIPVRGAPSDCGQGVRLRIRAEGKCGETPDAAYRLRVRGEPAPPGAELEVHDAASDALLATSQASARGRFDLTIPMPAPPAAIDVTVSAGGLSWTLDSIPVQIRSCDDDEEEEDGDDEVG